MPAKAFWMLCISGGLVLDPAQGGHPLIGRDDRPSTARIAQKPLDAA
jgi:hypothetical protein